ncbi:hypothetical protein H6P81_012256 [Aristolochia fimbriata]|uniref:Nudix hydrolase domain-containing protein n=1 Tax=Aristolochia fimbriata TaxID=158543 RepID=A0AAV7EBL9_ARIFI|nr:hypothetical protein H6P81_012256 [Aristolochia fimbriata]
MIAALARVRRLQCWNPLISPLMDRSLGGSRIRSLAQQLRLYKAPTWSDDGEEERSGRIISQIGVPESASPIISEMKLRPKRAAVLICLFEDDEGDIRVILTKRSSNLSTHSGEVSLPGGKADEADEDERMTAMREAREEIGLDPSLVNVVTLLEPFLSKHLLRVTPVVGILSDKRAFKPVLNPDEVEAIFDCPLEMFLKDDKHRTENREWLGTSYTIHFFDYQRPPCFDEHRPDYDDIQRNKANFKQDPQP